jgi:hypothetical protein
MSQHEKVITKNSARKIAEDLLEHGACLLIRALNATEQSSIPYRYSQEDIEKFKSHLMEIMVIVEKGEIELTQTKAAMNDKDYQKFRNMVFSSDWYKDDRKFNKAAYYSISPLYRNEPLDKKLKRWQDMD